MSVELEAMRTCYRHAATSLDPSTQNAAVLIDRNGRICVATLTKNDFPYGIADRAERWERPLKYSYIEHAERASLYAAAHRGIPTWQTTLVCPWAPCADCARAVILSGVRRLVRRGNLEDTNERWHASVAIGDELLIEAGVEIVNDPTIHGDLPAVRRNGIEILP